MSEPVLQVVQLRKRFRSFVAVDGISFDIDRGSVLGLLGPNGAGKTTTMHMLAGLTVADGGTIHYFGKDLSRHRRACLQRINFTSSYNTLQIRISVLENLRVFAGLYGVRDSSRKIRELAGYFEVTELMDQLVASLSAGQRTRVNLVKSLLNDPEVLLMDEPTASLDPDIADKTLTLIERLRLERGLSILYTSHNMAEVARICDSVIFLDHGRIVAHDTPAGLTKRFPQVDVRIVVVENDVETARGWLKTKGYAHKWAGSHVATISTREHEIGRMLHGLGEAGIDILDVEVRKPTLEDVFLDVARA